MRYMATFTEKMTTQFNRKFLRCVELTGIMKYINFLSMSPPTFFAQVTQKLLDSIFRLSLTTI